MALYPLTDVHYEREQTSWHLGTTVLAKQLHHYDMRAPTVSRQEWKGFVWRRGLGHGKLSFKIARGGR